MTKSRIAVVVIASLAILAPIACGDDSDDEPSQSADPATEQEQPRKPVDENKDPDKVTCADLQGPGGGALALVAGNTLAGRVELDASRLQVSNRIRFALEGICKKSGQPDYRPADEAVKAVEAGKYKTATG